MEEIKTLTAELTDQEFDQFLYWVLNIHRDERKTRRAEEQAKAKVLAELIAAGKLAGAQYITYEEALGGVKPPSWKNPGDDELRMFPTGAVVSRYSKTYLNTLEDQLNPHEPGGDETPDGAWREITAEVKAAAKQREVDAAAPEDTGSVSDEVPEESPVEDEATG